MIEFVFKRKLWYLFQDFHGKYLPSLGTLNLPHLENLKKDFVFTCYYHEIMFVVLSAAVNDYQ